MGKRTFSREFKLEAVGVNYRIQIVEEFKGKLSTESVWFSTDRLLLPQHQIKPGDHVLLLLRHLSKEPESGNVRAAENLAIASIPTTDGCRRARKDLYLSDFAENVFLIEFGKSGQSTSQGWLEFSPARTSIADGTTRVEKPRCQPSDNGCVENGFAHVSWPSVRRSLQTSLQ